MCGIVGYIGHKQASDIVLNGLEALEYRGYDSAGLVFFDQQNRPELIKQTGRVKNLLPLLDQVNRANQLAIGHTRWAAISKKKPPKIKSIVRLTILPQPTKAVW